MTIELTKAQRALLAELDDTTNGRFIGRLPGATSTMAKRLVEAGLVAHTPETECDWPVWSITDAGRAALEQGGQS